MLSTPQFMTRNFSTGMNKSTLESHRACEFLMEKKTQPNLIPSKMIPIGWVDLDSSAFAKKIRMLYGH